MQKTNNTRGKYLKCTQNFSQQVRCHLRGPDGGNNLLNVDWLQRTESRE